MRRIKERREKEVGIKRGKKKRKEEEEEKGTTKGENGKGRREK